MRIGIDSYSYHRLLGEVRPGEARSRAGFRRGSLDAVGEARALGADLISLETCFLPAPAALDAGAYRAAAGPRTELALAWGHPTGLEWGARDGALEELLSWLRVAPRLGVRLVRMVASSPRHPLPADREAWLPATAAAIDRALDVAADAGIELVVENHADLTVDALLALLERCDRLGVCLDTANALRVGDDPVDAARRLRDRVGMMHLKDVEAGEGEGRVAGPRSVPYGTGVVALDEVLDALGTRLEGLPVCVELAQLGPGDVDERELVAAAVAWLRDRRAGRGVLRERSLQPT